MEVSMNPIDVPKLFRLWNTPGLTINEVAAALGVSLNVLRKARDRYGLSDTPPELPDDGEPKDGDPTPEEIAERAAAIRAEWPEGRWSEVSHAVTCRYSYDGRQRTFRRLSH
jgi:transposase-like protein